MRRVFAAAVLAALASTSNRATAQTTAAGLPVAAPAPTVYHEFQVTKPVQLAPAEKAPDYPADLRAAGIEGNVTVQFIVDTLGHADSASIHIIKTTNAAFATAVRAHVPRMLFVPAELNGVKVAQLVSMPFIFSLSKKPPRS